MTKLTLRTKKDILREIEQRNSYRDIANKFKVSVGTVTNIKKEGKDINSAINENVDFDSSMSKRLKDEAAVLDKRVFMYKQDQGTYLFLAC